MVLFKVRSHLKALQAGGPLHDTESELKHSKYNSPVAWSSLYNSEATLNKTLLSTYSIEGIY